MLVNLISIIPNPILIIIGVALFLIGAKLHNKNMYHDKIKKEMSASEANKLSIHMFITTLAGLFIFCGLFTIFATIIKIFPGNW